MPKQLHLSSLAAWLCLSWGCGDDPEERFAGLSSVVVSSPEVTYTVRYLAPPWERIKDDPLVTGARRSVPVGGALREVVPESALVLQVDRASTIDEIGRTYAKYVWEVSALRCDAGELPQADSCARSLAAADYEARAATEDSGFFGATEHPGVNNFAQRYYELMTRDLATYRYRRVVFFETEDRLLTLRLYIEGNPSLATPEITRMVQALQVLADSETAALGGGGQ